MLQASMKFSTKKRPEGLNFLSVVSPKMRIVFFDRFQEIVVQYNKLSLHSSFYASNNMIFVFPSSGAPIEVFEGSSSDGFVTVSRSTS